ncbi:MAG: T9SS type B sorting domain-containing protein [Saprospiraceae bacterium]|nr:T9SS type B sorting domain-containing protein [Saprospiraceae bacterium]
MKQLLVGLLALSCLMAQAQDIPSLVAHYSFENCDATDVSLNNSDGILFGNPTCECGIQGDALAFDGVDDYAVLAGNVESYFDADIFTLSMYFRTTDNAGVHDVLSKRSNCNLDRAFAVRYAPASRTLFVDIAESDSLSTTFMERLDPGLCWIHLVVVKDSRSHSIYVNGAFVASQPTFKTFDLTTMAPIQIGNGPCIGSTDRRFQGLVDEVKFFNEALSPGEISSLYLAPDRLITADTTIYQGSDAILRSGPTCAPTYSWVPAGQTSPSDELTTTATPPNTQTFTMQYQYESCTATDTARISVINPDDIECGNVPLPNAFTPNGDGRNDLFFISNPFALEVLQAFEIFDRWGNLVFTTTDVRSAWDGLYRGNAANPGLYMYKIKYTCQGEDLIKSGSIMLIR